MADGEDRRWRNPAGQSRALTTAQEAQGRRREGRSKDTRGSPCSQLALAQPVYSLPARRPWRAQPSSLFPPAESSSSDECAVPADGRS